MLVQKKLDENTKNYFDIDDIHFEKHENYNKIFKSKIFHLFLFLSSSSKVKHNLNGVAATCTRLKSFFHFLLRETKSMSYQWLHINLPTSQKLQTQWPRVLVPKDPHHINLPDQPPPFSFPATKSNSINIVQKGNSPGGCRSKRNSHLMVAHPHQTHFAAGTCGGESRCHCLVETCAIKAHIHSTSHGFLYRFHFSFHILSSLNK